MTTLALANRTKTFERLREPLGERGIDLTHLAVRERVIPLTDRSAAPWAPDDVDVGWVHPARLYEGEVATVLAEVPWINDREAVLTSRNKAGVIARLDRAGLPVPETVHVSNPVDDDTLLEAAARFDGPMAVKPNTTTRGVGVARVDDADSLLGVTDYLDLVHAFPATGDKSFLVQEFLPAARDYRAMVVDGEVVGAVERRLDADARAAGRWKHNVHRGAEAVGVELPAASRELAEAAAAELDLDLVGVDLLVTDDRTVVSETNARPTVDAATKYAPDFHDRLAALIERTADRDASGG